MLQNVRLKNFKCFEHVRLECTPLTLLCGLNGMGKSSLLQALLVMRQSLKEGAYLHPTEIVLGGEYTDLGTGADVLYEDAETNTIEIEVCDDRIPEPYLLEFEYERQADRLTLNKDKESVMDKTGTITDDSAILDWASTPPVGGEMLYISAERIGPRKLYPLSETTVRRGSVGTRTEFALARWNARQGDILQRDDPRCAGQNIQTLAAILEYWLSFVSPGAHLQLEAISGADALLARFSFDRSGDVITRPYRATNVGFGLSYTLPVLISLLSPAGTLCLIENPEAHLHPRGQTKLAELAVRASTAGVQVIVETHSDHFLDGVRIAVRDGLIQPTGVAIHYFERDKGRTIVSSPVLDEDGRLSSWPDGFFGQHEENLARLLQPREQKNA